MQLGRLVSCSSAALLLGLVSLVVAHGDEHNSIEGMNMGGAHESHSPAVATAATNSTVEMSYFRYPEYQGWLYAHIATMTLAWVIVLPIGIMLSIARSRLTIPAQLSFLAVNATGVFTSIIYNTHTPDLYPNNAHHKIGWVATWIGAAWFAMAFPMILGKKPSASRHAMTSQNMAQYDRLHSEADGFTPGHAYRSSRDSDASATLCSGLHSPSSDVGFHKLEPESPTGDYPSLPYHDEESTGFLQDPSAPAASSKLSRFLTMKSTDLNVTGTALTALKVSYVTIERTFIILAFVALCTGFVTWGNLFRARRVFSGAAHFVKGGIFFWYGLLTLGRWMGAFADYGWAWNLKPTRSDSTGATGSRLAPLLKKKKTIVDRMPSAEFVESFVIWLYGASNVFLEHLNAWGKAWTFEDFEHISITVMFFGGGLLGMLVESERFKSLLNTSISLREEEAEQTFHKSLDEERAVREGFSKPRSYKHSLNPVPALVILLLGRMMSGHHQKSMVSTMMHAQWGSLFVGFALARGLTYALLYLSPPTSFFPSRPPSELVTSFCLISGGMIFMGSATDTVAAVEQNGLDAMFLFTVAMGFTALFMAWAAILFAIKGWAVKRETKRAV